jgi:RNA polymerase sigma factor (sigma-70 family)
MSQAAASLSHGHVPVAALRLLGDEALARRVANGDGQAFAALYQRHHQALYRYCRAILGNAEDAADALQNTMAAALRALPGEQRELRIKPWLYRIAHNESISLARRRPPFTGLEHAMEVPDARGSDPATRERLRQLFADLHALQERQRAALVMRELNGLGYEEIGSALASTPAAAKQLVYEARSALHEMAEGREMSCELVRTSLSADDRRKLRGRRFRAHLEGCPSCREFQRSMDMRRRDLAALAPPLPALAAASILHGLGGGGHAGAASSLAGLAGGGTGKAVATSAVVKGVAAVAVVATVGTGTAGLTGNLPGLGGHKTRHEAVGGGRSASPAGERNGMPGTSERRQSPGGTSSPKERTLSRRHGKGRVPGLRPSTGNGRTLSHPPRAREGVRGRVTPGRAPATAKPHSKPATRRPTTHPRKPTAVPPGRAEPNRGEVRKPADVPALDPSATSP